MSKSRSNAYQVIISDKAQKELARLPKKDAYRIAIKIKVLSTDPYVAKQLLGELSGSYSLRIWPYRVIYKVNKSKVELISTTLVIGKEFINSPCHCHFCSNTYFICANQKGV